MAEPRDDDLVTELRALADWLDLPPTPDVRAEVRARLAADPGRAAPGRWRPRWSARPRWSRRWAAVAAAAAVTVLLAVLPPSRAAVADVVGGLLRFAGVEVRLGQPTAAPSASPLPGGRSAALDQARRQARFPIGVPELLGVPEEVLLFDPAPDGAPRVVSLGYRGGMVRLDEFDGALEPVFLKTARDGSWVQVNDATGLWFETPHDVEYLDAQGTPHRATARLAGPTLIWTAGTVTYRLEGPFRQDEAIAIAASLR